MSAWGSNKDMGGVDVGYGVDASATLNVQPDAEKKTIGSIWASVKAWVGAKTKMGDASIKGDLSTKLETDRQEVEFGLGASEGMRLHDERLRRAMQD